MVLPAHLRNLAGVHGEVLVRLSGPGAHPAGGARRARVARTRCSAARSGTGSTGKRRAFIRFYACEQDLSNEPPDAPLPDAVAAAIVAGTEPFLVVGAMAGG